MRRAHLSSCARLRLPRCASRPTTCEPWHESSRCAGRWCSVPWNCAALRYISVSRALQAWPGSEGRRERGEQRGRRSGARMFSPVVGVRMCAHKPGAAEGTGPPLPCRCAWRPDHQPVTIQHSHYRPVNDPHRPVSVLEASSTGHAWAQGRSAPAIPDARTTRGRRASTARRTWCSIDDAPRARACMAWHGMVNARQAAVTAATTAAGLPRARAG